MFGFLSKPIYFLITVGLVMLETTALVYCVPKLISVRSQLSEIRLRAAQLEAKKNELETVIAKQNAGIQVINAVADGYKNQLTQTEKMFREKDKQAQKKIKALQNQTVNNDMESIKAYLLEGRED